MKSHCSKAIPILSRWLAPTMSRANPSCWRCSKDVRSRRWSTSSRPSPSGCKTTVKEVCTDLYDGFIHAVEEGLPQAPIVADRFQVAKLYRAAVDPLRKIEMKALKQVFTKEQYAGLKGVLWALRKRSEKLAPEEHALLDRLFEASPVLRKAYTLREKLTRIFDKKHSKKSGRRAIRRWVAQVRDSGLECFDTFLSTLERKFH